MVLEEHQMLQMDYEQEIENMASSVQATNDKLQEGIQVQLGSVVTNIYPILYYIAHRFSQNERRK